MDPVIRRLRKAALPKCTYCRKPADTKDHVPPMVVVGRHQRTVPACFHCNSVILHGMRLLTVADRRRYVRTWWEEHVRNATRFNPLAPKFVRESRRRKDT